jgi:hypothetical protein
MVLSTANGREVRSSPVALVIEELIAYDSVPFGSSG